MEQVASETGFKGEEKLEQARTKIRSELNKYNISMTDRDLDTFVESAVKQNERCVERGIVMDIDTSRYREGLPQIGYAPYRQIQSHD